MAGGLKHVQQEPQSHTRARRNAQRLATDAADSMAQELESRAMMAASLPSRPAVKADGGVSRVGGLNIDEARQELKSRDILLASVKGMTKANVDAAIAAAVATASQELKSRDWIM